MASIQSTLSPTATPLVTQQVHHTMMAVSPMPR